MENKITGRVLVIGTTQTIILKNGNPFNKREITLDTTYKDYPNYPTFEFCGDKCDELDKFKVGQSVTITFSLQGFRIENKDGVKYFTKVRGYKIEDYKSAQQPSDWKQNPVRQSVPSPKVKQNAPAVPEEDDFLRF